MSTGLGIGRAGSGRVVAGDFLDRWSTGPKIALCGADIAMNGPVGRAEAKETNVKSHVQYKLVRLCLAAASIAVFVEALGAGRRW